VLKYLTPQYRAEGRARRVIGLYLQKRIDERNSGVAGRRDLIQWLIDEAPAGELDVPHLVRAIFGVFAVNHSATTHMIANAVFMLATDPETHLHVLREELMTHYQGVVPTKAVLAKLTELDKFLDEALRMNSATTLTSERIVLQDFTFKDGTVLPRGTMIGVPNRAAHYDPARYPSPETFNPDRSVPVGSKRSTSELTCTTRVDHLHFGYGRHAW
jgi:cytochrome P450